METIIPIIVVIVELALLTYSLVVKSSAEKIRHIVRICALIVFTLLVSTSIVQWSFRWYGLAALLFFWAALGTYALLRKTEERTFRARQIVARSLSAGLLTLIAVTPAMLFPDYEPLPPTGPHEVATAHYTYTDESRLERFVKDAEHRHVNVAFWYPNDREGNETYPLIVFSHGGLGTENSNESLFLELASHGYVVASIGHPYHALWTKDEDGRVTFVNMDYFRELQREDAKRDKEQSYRYYRSWMETRMGDINFAINTILMKKAENAGSVYNLIDVERIGVMGHSLGGSAVLGIPRQRDDIDAVIALESPFLYDIVGVESNEFIWLDEVYPAPVLNRL
ncbi:MAG: alpha/beta hydrolase [Anaerolineales bacterium]|nr:alpha/beta hydrolase [Anaerolineales bacterium]